MHGNVEREELERLMASPHLSGKRAREALAFLCERYWSGEKVTQYDLSEKLYGTVENSVAARNLVKNLRQKIALHYAGEGRRSPVRLAIPSGQYDVVFEAHDPDVSVSEDPAAQTAGEGRSPRNGKARSHIGLLITALVLALLSVLTIVLLPGFIESRRPAATSVAIEGSAVIGQSADDPELWREGFPAPIFRAVELDADSVNRFAVLYGGLMTNRDDAAEVIPQLAILSPRGEVLSTLDLLDEFNPFLDTHDQHYFRFGLCLVQDLDLDGHKDILLSCNHLFYPSIVYAVSGRKMAVIGTFANSGKVKSLIPFAAIPGALGASVAGLAINNKMGEQLCVFRMSMTGRFVSPDFDAGGIPVNTRYRPIPLSRPAFEPLKLEQGGLFRAFGVNDESILFDVQSVSLESDPWFGSGTATEEAMNRLARFYPRVSEARRFVRDGMIDEGQVQYDIAISEALDEPLRLYVILDAARELKAAGKPRLALDRLPADPSEVIFPRRVLLLRGELLTILGEYDAAKDAFGEANNLHYSFDGFVQATILGGADSQDLYNDIVSSYPSKMNIRATRAWLKIPSLLRGECTMADSGQDNAHLLAGDKETVEDNIRYSQETTIWNAFVDLELGLEPQVWPDADRKPMEYSDGFELKLLALEALRHRRQNAPASALPMLESAFRTLEQAARTDHDALVPLILVAYTCGFTADETGRAGLAREALGHAVSLYPHGRKFDRARRILEAYNDDD